MPKGDLQKQYSSCCEVAGQVRSSTVIELSIKPLSYLYLYLFWGLIEHTVIVWNSILIRYLTLKITIRTFLKILLLIFWCICACVSEIRVFQLLVFVQFCTSCRIVLYALGMYVQPSLCLHLLTAVYVF